MTMAGTLLIGLGRAARQAWRAPRPAVLGLRLAWCLALVSVLARVAPLRRLQRFFCDRTASRSSHHPSPEQLARAIDAILRLDLPIVRRGRCWKRALVLQRFLVRQGIECRVTFGVRRTSGGVLEGHAWLERDGRPFLEPGTDTDSYAVTFTLTTDEARPAIEGRPANGRRR
jgi:hypothetical protein